jgi:hypothetical protein
LFWNAAWQRRFHFFFWSAAWQRGFLWKRVLPEMESGVTTPHSKRARRQNPV